ncbi:hypothetical protein BJX61DRAFT_87002 [Aspergillus egyptiacus]|nr:hypothetical protein BJX61DRAFT_87002 [Aspergillus egyptiacus]
MAFYRRTIAALAWTLCINPVLSGPDRFDFVIVGGGTAGLAVANRLSEISDITVAVIEAGKDEGTNPNVTRVDEFGGGLGFSTSVDWLYQTTEQVYARGRQLEYHQGKAWGGTSTINGMTYIRAEDVQIDAWETLGNPGWNWSSLWPYHLKSEGFEPPTQPQLAAGASFRGFYHSQDGPVNVAYQDALQNGSLAALANQTWQRLGVPFNSDASGGNLRGFFVWPQTLDREANVREDAARAYYYPVKGRSNIVILRGHVDKITWASMKGSKVLAEGVEYTAPDGSVRTLHVDREVIVSAGAIRSPAILELSGVGNPQLLQGLGIPVKVPLPSVGENGLEQPKNNIRFSSSSSFNGFTPYASYMTASDILGPKTQAVSTAIAAQLKHWAKQLAAESNNAVSASAIERLYQLQHHLIFNLDVPCVEILPQAIGNNVGAGFYILLPFSRGSVHINSSDPSTYPSINPNYFKVNWDLTLQRKTAQTAARFWQTDPIRSLVGERTQPPPETLPENATDEQWDAWVVNSFTPNHHLLGTAAMLPLELGGVVDPSLRVYGTQNVRVIDASVFPSQISGHLTSAIYAVAERAAEIIKREMGML